MNTLRKMVHLLEWIPFIFQSSCNGTVAAAGAAPENPQEPLHRWPAAAMETVNADGTGLAAA
jgi:hypothetical protein